MAYTTVQIVRDATGFQDSTKVPDAYITRYIGYADGLINGAVGNVYTLPLSSTPNVIAFFSLELTVVALYMDQYGEEASDQEQKGWKARIDLITKQLELIRTGKLKLFNDTTGDELAKNGNSAPRFYPTVASSDPAAEDTTKPRVTVNRQF